MHFYYHPRTLEIKMQSDTQVETSLGHFEHTPTGEEQEKIDQNYKMYFKGGKIQFRKPRHVKEKDEKRKQLLKKDDITSLKQKAEAGQLSANDLLSFIEKYQ